MKTRTVLLALNAARLNFDREVDLVAEMARDQLVPYFKKRSWSYMTANGTWTIEDRKERPIEDHKLPTAVRALLYLEVQPGQPLGCFIRPIGHPEVP